LLADLNRGHKVQATVYVECGSMYRADGPAALRPVGETEFVNGVAAMSASGLYGPIRACAGIVGHADLTLGGAVSEVLEAHMAASSRFRGIRHSASADADAGVLGPLAHRRPGLYLQDDFRAGFAGLAALGLSFDAWLLEPQLDDVVDLARAFPDTSLILDHVGTPLGTASYAGRREARFAGWRDKIRALAEAPNVSVKLGGLAMSFCNFRSFLSEPPAPSTQLAAEWKPYIETCIEAFGPERCSCDYDVLWNAFKVIAAGYSTADKTALFSGTARRVYRLDA
jgi:L-fuconolactonase